MGAGTVWQPTVVATLFCLLSVPVAYGFNQVARSFDSVAMVITAVGIMTVIPAAIYVLTRVKNKMFYGFALFAFTSAVDLLIPLEMDGFVHGFMDVYLMHGEPYLHSAWGAIAAYWDGTFYLACYLIMSYYASNGFSYRTLGMYYSASILNSMVVLLLGACLSQTGLHWCTLLNIPYVLVPLLVVAKSLHEPRHKRVKINSSKWLDRVLALLLIEAAIAALIRGVTSLGSAGNLFSWYRNMVEPILNENIPAPFASIQGLVSLFYFTPAFLALAVGVLTNPGQGWVHDLAILTAGATSQAGVVQIGMPLHPLTEAGHGIPSIKNHSAFFTFWSVNILIAILPQIVALRLCWLPENEKKTSSKKEKNIKSTKKNKKTD